MASRCLRYATLYYLSGITEMIDNLTDTLIGSYANEITLLYIKNLTTAVLIIQKPLAPKL